MFKLMLNIIVSGTIFYFSKSVLLAIGVFIALTILIIWFTQFDIVRLEEAVNQAKGNLEDAFQKRYDTLTKIFETTKGYVNFKEHELETITNAFGCLENLHFEYKDKYHMQNRIQKILIRNISQLRDDKVGQKFDTLNRSINEVEENLSASRRFYNYTIKEYNTAINVFPTMIVAKKKGYKVMSYFEVESENIKQDIEIKFDN